MPGTRRLLAGPGRNFSALGCQPLPTSVPQLTVKILIQVLPALEKGLVCLRARLCRRCGPLPAKQRCQVFSARRSQVVVPERVRGLGLGLGLGLALGARGWLPTTMAVLVDERRRVEA